MQTFAQESSQSQKAKSFSRGRPDLAKLGSAPLELHLHSQRTVGNQALPRMLNAQAEKSKAGLTAMPSRRLGHDFSRIPIHPPTAGVIQAKLVINQPGDAHEQEADRVAEQVLRMPEPQLQRKCADCEKDESEQKNGLRMKHVNGSNLGKITAPPIVHDVLRSPGQPLEAATRTFMEPRFGRDFSQVRIHTDSKAAESARAVNARAYTVGRNIVFGFKEYSPSNEQGRRLIGHELTHVAQNAGTPSILRRDILDDLKQVGKNLKDIRVPTGFRHLDPKEESILRPIFGSSLDYSQIHLTNGLGYQGRPFTVPDPTGQAINIGSAAFDKPGSDPALLVHEATHCWQYQHGVSLTTTAKYASQGDYNYGGKAALLDAIGTHKCFTAFVNTEHQASIVEDYYRMGGAHPWSVFIDQLRANGKCIWETPPDPKKSSR
jgi:hypothetical protein